MSEFLLEGVKVQFPFKPHAVQKQYMTNLVKCLQTESNCLLESPAGTGKTLALLCSSLAWVLHQQNKMQDEAEENYIFNHFDFDNVLAPNLFHSYENKGDIGKRNFSELPQVIYSSETNVQLSQAMQLFKDSPYKFMKATELGLLQNMCIHSDIKHAKDNISKMELCQKKLKEHSCSYYDKVEIEKNCCSGNGLADIEDLMDMGKNKNFCPYYMSKELIGNSYILFLPHKYLLDIRTRNKLNLNLNNSILIFDNARNFDKMCEDFASAIISCKDIQLSIILINELIDMNNNNAEQSLIKFDVNDLIMMNFVLEKFLQAVQEVQLLDPRKGISIDGYFLFHTLAQAGMNESNKDDILNLLKSISDYVLLLKYRLGKFKERNNHLQLVYEFLFLGFEHTQQEIKQYYKIHVTNDFGRYYNIRKDAKKKLKYPQRKLVRLWCISPAIGLKKLKSCGVRNIIITNDILAPIDTLIAELEMKFDFVLHNPHLVKSDQILFRILPESPDKVEFKCTYNDRYNPEYIHTVGMTIANLLRMIPKGVVVYFISLPFMKMCLQNWRYSNIYDTICKIKPVFVEPRTKSAVGQTLNKYYDAITGPANGAVLMALNNGHASKDMNFADSNCRGVILTGIPFPCISEPRVIMKKNYMNGLKLSSQINGNFWYNSESSRALNQGLSKAVSHLKDYAAIICLDNRLGLNYLCKYMPKYLRPHHKIVPYQPLVMELRKFYRKAEATFPDTDILSEPARRLELCIKSFADSRDSALCTERNTLSCDIQKKTDKRVEHSLMRSRFLLKSKQIKPNDFPFLTNDPSIADIEKYLIMMRRNLTPVCDAQFMKLVKSYMSSRNFAEICLAVEFILSQQPTIGNLLFEFRIFMIPSHQLRFKTLMKRYLKL